MMIEPVADGPVGAAACRKRMGCTRSVRGLGGTGVEAREPLAAPAGERPGADRLAGAAHQGDEEMYVVQAQETKPQHLLRGHQVAHVGPGEPAAGGAGAPLLERPRV